MCSNKIYRSNYAEKKLFVEEVVNPLLLNSHLNCSAVYYKPNEMYDDEYILLYKNNNSLTGKIDITCDSIQAIVSDVSKYLCEHKLKSSDDETYGCDICGDRKHWNKDIVWVTSTYGVCEKCYIDLTPDELDNLRKKYE